MTTRQNTGMEGSGDVQSSGAVEDSVNFDI